MAKEVRLLVCHACESVQEIPWCGEDPQCNHPGCVEPLEFRVAEHTFADGRAHAPANLAAIDKAVWDKFSTKQDVLLQLKRIVNPGAGAGLGESLYDVKSNFEMDAMACWKQHKRTQDCGDWKKESKRLDPDTNSARKDLGMPRLRQTKPTTFLCDYCPMRSIKQTKMGADKFGFNNPY